MVVSGGPSIVDEGLVLHLDAGDRACYRGEPTTNLMPHTNGITGRVGWPGGAYTHSIETTGDYAGWQKMVVTSTGSISNFIMRLGDVTCSPGVVYTATIEYYAPYANLKFHISGAHGNYSPVRIGDTNKYYLTFTFGAASAGSMGWWLLTTASTPANTAITNGVIYYRRAQFEQKPYYTDFTIGTRGSTVATGGGLLDLTNNGNDGGINRTSVPASAFYNSANKGYFSFDGSNDYIRVLENNSLKTASNGQFTKSAWFMKQGSLNENYGNVIWHKRTIIGVDSGAVLSNLNNEIYSYVGANILVSNVSAEDDRWYNVHVVYDNTSCKIYVDGELKNSITSTLENENGVTFDIGSGYGINNYWKGKISQVCSYNRALTPEEIQQNYHATKGRFL